MPLSQQIASSRLARVLFLVLASSATWDSNPRSASATSASNATLVVYVFDAAEPLSISGASVRVLSEEGKVLATAITDESGEAHILKPDPALRPSLILVQHQAFYIGGRRWSDGADEVCVHLAMLRTCCITRVVSP